MIPLFFGTSVPHIEQLSLFKAPWLFGSVAGSSLIAEPLLMLHKVYAKSPRCANGTSVPALSRTKIASWWKRRREIREEKQAKDRRRQLRSQKKAE
jgi:hypothetical protein